MPLALAARIYQLDGKPFTIVEARMASAIESLLFRGTPIRWRSAGLLRTYSLESIKLPASGGSTRFRPGRDPMMLQLKVRLRFLTPEEGGRQTPPASGYRPPVWFGELDDSGGEVLRDWSFEFEGPDGGILDNLELGHEGTATMTSISHAPPERRLAQDQRSRCERERVLSPTALS